MHNFSQLATNESLEKTKLSLEEHGLTVLVTQNAKDAKEKALSLIPKGSEVLTASSQTLEALGITDIINESGEYDSVKAKLGKMNRETQSFEMQKLGAAPEYVIGSVHAVTMDGKVLDASNTGSQLAAYTYGASHVIWVVSTKKIVKDLEEGIKRIYEFVLPLEDARMKKVYGPNASSNVRKLYILNSELNHKRTTLIFVKENLGF